MIVQIFPTMRKEQIEIAVFQKNIGTEQSKISYILKSLGFKIKKKILQVSRQERAIHLGW